MIKTVIRCPDNTVMVFDERGAVMPVYQGKYERVRDNVLRDTGMETVFSHYFDNESALMFTPREAW